MKEKVRCNICEHNPMGTCELCGREIPMAYVINRINKAPTFCPLLKGVKCN